MSKLEDQAGRTRKVFTTSSVGVALVVGPRHGVPIHGLELGCPECGCDLTGAFPVQVYGHDEAARDKVWWEWASGPDLQCPMCEHEVTRRACFVSWEEVEED